MLLFKSIAAVITLLLFTRSYNFSTCIAQFTTTIESSLKPNKWEKYFCDYGLETLEVQSLYLKYFLFHNRFIEVKKLSELFLKQGFSVLTWIGVRRPQVLCDHTPSRH